MARRSASILFCLLVLAAPASAGVVSGRVTLGRTGGADGAARAESGIADVVVWVEQVPANVEKKLAGGGGWWLFRRHEEARLPRLEQSDQRFRPRVLAAVAGQAVEFRNQDRVYHNAFSSSAARRFDLGKYAPGHADTLDFPRPGIVNVLCDIHPRELAYVVVVPNHALARPDSAGRYALPRLPAGAYTVRAWHPRRGEITRAVVVPKRGDVRLDLAL